MFDKSPLKISGSYDEVVKALAQSERGSYGDLSYMPVFRASALFYAYVDEVTTTRVAFLNYWREKNNNPNVGILVTVRDQNGIKRGRRFERLSAMTGQFDVRDFLGPNEIFRGSIELEAFSSEDLKFQFPGLSVFYQSARGVSYVHTNQRVYNSVEDRDRGSNLNPWQTGFEINTEKYDPFVFVVNGPKYYPGGFVDLLVINFAGSEMSCQIPFQALPAYGAYDFRLRTVPDIVTFLGRQPGLCKLNIELEDIHLRLGVGNALKDHSWLSITHSYFDATEHQDYFDTPRLLADIYAAFIPFILIDGIDVDLVFYPIYAKSEFTLSFQGFDDAGNEVFYIPVCNYRSPENGMLKINVRQLLRQADIADISGLYVLQIAAENKLPARITYGLNYYLPGNLGTNISASVYIAKSWGLGSRSWRWCPVVAMAGARNIVMVCAFSKNKNERLVSPVTLAIYDRQGIIAKMSFELRGNTGVSVVIEELFEKNSYTPILNDILWCVVESNHACLDVNQICVSADGFIGGDHGF